MGGYNSGRHAGKLTVSESLRLELPELKKRGFLQPGHKVSGKWAWTRRGEDAGDIGLCVELSTAQGAMILDYNFRGEPVHQTIDVTGEPMRFGGRRWWAHCPISFRRCGTLVFSYRHQAFVSVKAAGLAYKSQNEAPIDRARSRAEKAERRFKTLSKYARLQTWTRLRDDWIEKQTYADRVLDDYTHALLARLV